MKQAFYYQTQVLQELWRTPTAAVTPERPERQDRRGEPARDGRVRDGR